MGTPQAEIAICTRNRSAEVRHLLSSLLALGERRRVIVADSSDDASTAAAVEGFSMLLDITYVSCAAGLTRQRQVAVSSVSNDAAWIHFIDDDVEVEPGYFDQIELCFLRHPEAAGVGGLITNLPRHNPWWLRRFFLIDSTQGGSVLRSGVNVLFFGDVDEIEVDWLSGCSMSYKLDLFSDIGFDTRMEGYCAGEDVDFSYRVKRSGLKLWATSQARLAHLCSAANRDDAESVYAVQIRRRHKWVAEMRSHGVSMLAFHWSMLGDLVVMLGKSVLSPRRSVLRRAGTVARTWTSVLFKAPQSKNARLIGYRDAR